MLTSQVWESSNLLWGLQSSAQSLEVAAVAAVVALYIFSYKPLITHWRAGSAVYRVGLLTSDGLEQVVTDTCH